MNERVNMKLVDATKEQFRSAVDVIELREQSFAFTLNHYRKGKLIHTASYNSFALAMRAARTAGLKHPGVQTFICVHNEYRRVERWD